MASDKIPSEPVARPAASLLSVIPRLAKIDQTTTRCFSDEDMGLA
jgi:hypothetical protein